MTPARPLRMYGEAIGLNPRFTIHDRGDSEDLMRAVVVELKLNKDDKKFPKKGTLMAIHSFVKYGELKCVEAAHVKDLMSFLRLAENPRDVVAGTRVLTLLPGVGPKKASQLMQMLAVPDAEF